MLTKIKEIALPTLVIVGVLAYFGVIQAGPRFPIATK